MNKRIWHWLLMAALVVGLGITVTSCKDDDDDGNKTKSPEQTEQEAQEATSKFWDVVGQLTSMDNYTADYKDKTFEPTIGEPQEGNPLIRVVATNDMASAVERYASLVGLEVGTEFPADTKDYTWKDDAVGTLSYHQTNNGQSWAEVDVDIKQVRLQKIIYCAPEQAGTNNSFRGSAYYRFGDVVSRENEDGKKEYWICVRPAFGKEGKGDSHWITLSPLPEKNVEHITKWSRDFYVPKGLGKNEEQMQNFAELLWAMIHPDAWYQYVRQFSAPSLLYPQGLRMFHDFSHDEDKVKYHNIYFWRRVREAWDREGLFKKVFGFTSDDDHFKDIFDSPIGTGRLHLLCTGYSWWNSVSGNLSLYEYIYETGDETRELNMHKVTKREVKKDMTDLNFDVRSEYTASAPYLMKSAFFGDSELRYIIRHATGKELVQSGSKWDYKQPISGVEPVYVYNYYYYPEGTDGGAPGTHFRDLTIADPEVTLDNNDKVNWNKDAYNGDSYYLTGDVCIDAEGSRWFCLLNSGKNSMQDTEALLNAPYSYFITFDNVIDEDGNIAKDIVQETTLPKLMVPLMHFYANYSNQPNSPLYGVFAQNILTNTGVDISKMAIEVDTLVTIQGTQNIDTRPGYCTTVAYPAEDGHSWQLMRIITDGAYDKTTNRQWHTFFYTKYENTNVPILLSDIASQEKVNSYAPDRWAVLPLHKTTQRRNCRTQADNRATNINNYLWVGGQPINDVTSMWNEPVMVFRLTQVYDRGGNHATMTYRGTKFVKYIPSKIRENEGLAGFPQTWWQINSVGVYTSNRMTKDGEPYKWPDWNNDIIR